MDAAGNGTFSADSSVEYYSSPRTTDRDALDALLEEMHRFRAAQDEMRASLERLVSSRPASSATVPGDGAMPLLEVDAAEAAVGRAMLVAERHADEVRQAAEAEAKQVVDNALQEAEQLAAETAARRAAAEKEIEQLEATANETRAKLVAEAETDAEKVRADARAEADKTLEAALQEAENVENDAKARREEAEREAQSTAAAAEEEKQRLLVEAGSAADETRAQARQEAQSILDEARASVEEVQRAAEESLSRRLAELTDEVGRTEVQLESLRGRKSQFEQELASRVRSLVAFLEPDPPAAGAPAAALQVDAGGGVKAGSARA